MITIVLFIVLITLWIILFFKWFFILELFSTIIMILKISVLIHFLSWMIIFECSLIINSLGLVCLFLSFLPFFSLLPSPPPKSSNPSLFYINKICHTKCCFFFVNKNIIFLFHKYQPVVFVFTCHMKFVAYFKHCHTNH